MALPPRIVYYGDRYRAESYLPIALKRLADLKARMEAGNFLQLSRTMTLDDGTYIRFRSMYGLDQIEIFAKPTEIFVEAEPVTETEEETIIQEYTFYVDTDQGRYWVRFSEVEDPETKIVEKVVQKIEYDELDESYENRGADTGHCRKSFEFYGQRYLLTSGGNAYDPDDYVVASYSGSDVQFLVNQDQFAFFVPSTYTIDGQLFSFLQDGSGNATVQAGSLIAMSEHYISTSSLKPIPHSIHMKCAGSYWQPQKTIGYEMDTGMETPPWDEDRVDRLNNVSGLANQVDNNPDAAFSGGAFGGSGAEDGEYYFNLIKDLERLAAAFNGITSINASRVTGIILTGDRDLLVPGTS